jgi:D-glycero-D-manno-heptose 1,7-bisphosphate phosphatase
MIFKARDEYGIDLSHSLLIGDKPSDIEAGLRAGVEKIVFVQGKQEFSALKEGIQMVRSLSEVIPLL